MKYYSNFIKFRIVEWVVWGSYFNWKLYNVQTFLGIWCVERGMRELVNV